MAKHVTDTEYDFIDLCRRNFIPRIEKMISMEEQHLRWLRDQKQTDFVVEASAKSVDMLIHLKIRLTQYNEYIASSSNG